MASYEDLVRNIYVAYPYCSYHIVGRWSQSLTHPWNMTTVKPYKASLIVIYKRRENWDHSYYTSLYTIARQCKIPIVYYAWDGVFHTEPVPNYTDNVNCYTLHDVIMELADSFEKTPPSKVPSLQIKTNSKYYYLTNENQ